MVEVLNGFTQVKLTGRIVQFCSGLNANRREDVTADLTFIKAMIVSVFGVKHVKAGSILQVELVDFIKGK